MPRATGIDLIIGANYAEKRSAKRRLGQGIRAWQEITRPASEFDKSRAPWIRKGLALFSVAIDPCLQGQNSSI